MAPYDKQSSPYPEDMMTSVLRSLTAVPTLALAAVAALSLAAGAQETPRTVTVTGFGEAGARPDIAIISAGVETEAKTARAALDANNEAMEKVLAALRKTGIAERDVQTSDFGIDPRIIKPKSSVSSDKNPQPTLRHKARNRVTATVRNLDALGTILDGLVSAGSNRVYGVTFGLAEPQPIEDEARKAAMADALSKARLFAQSGGVKLGKILEISESPSLAPQPRMRAATLAADSAPVPLATGEHTVRTQVTVVWELAD